MTAFADATAIAHAIQEGSTTAQAVVEQALQDIDQRNRTLNCFTLMVAERAQQRALEIDQAKRQGRPMGPLAGVPFGVKSLFDIAGHTTLAGSKINRDRPPAQQDATAIARLEQAGAILVGALNMDEYAYGFVTVNHHYGATPNPHAPQRVAGGSSGGAAAAIAARLVPLTLGSDTNGSIRVPAALCGIYGLKPTYGRLSRAGTALFSTSLDHIGPMARSVRDIAISFDVMQGADPRDPVCTHRPATATANSLTAGIEPLNIALLDNDFTQGMQSEVAASVAQIVSALGITHQVTLPRADIARAAAYLITAAEGSELHLPDLQTRLQDFDPATRDRFVAGALIPQNWYIKAQRVRRWFQTEARKILQTYDVLIAPTVPCIAPFLRQSTMTIDGQSVLVRPHLGLYTQPLSFIGLPALSVPVIQAGTLPTGVQIIAAPYQEAKILQVAQWLEAHRLIAPFPHLSQGHPQEQR
ncbi:MAG: AtzE family amidohydrolase [Leptolyngbyaceae cyanobacterium]